MDTVTAIVHTLLLYGVYKAQQRKKPKKLKNYYLKKKKTHVISSRSAKCAIHVLDAANTTELGTI